MATHPLRHAFKEWAVICRALAEGRQAIILRKGGIAEEGGEFAVEHNRFWLYPTYLHQQESGLHPDAAELLRQVEAERPPNGLVRVSHWVEVAGIYQLHDIVSALKLQPFHLWSLETVTKRFFYRSPGLYALPVRVYRAAAVELRETEYYAGCRSWVELERDLDADYSAPVLSDAAFADVRRRLDDVLQPTAYA
jgi:hypothetical protein